MENNFNYLKETVDEEIFTQWQEVDVEIYAFTDLGIKVAINDEYTGLVYGNQVYEDYRLGQKLKAYIKLIRDDGKIDVSMQPKQEMNVLLTTEKILDHLMENGGKSEFNDKSSPENIKKEFQVSKIVFKQAIGKLYKHHKIKITNQGIELVKTIR
ncbi:MAG: type I-B CRISPR-associated protein Cas8b1/Cst1 [Calditrichaeota bacterium]|nr:MAG: type I-B CRISPR-associated protein Cas8b1/Cst1 [Calditrichota bacterium]